MNIDVTRKDREFVLAAHIDVAAPLDEVFEFFSNPANLETITPSSLSFAISKLPEGGMAEGVTIDYRLKVRGVPMKWRSLISEWDPPHAFTDEQLRGPYRQWIHRHSFAALDEHSTRVTDTVRYRPPFGRLANWLLVERDVRQIFEYRTAFLAERFGVVGGAPVSE